MHTISDFMQLKTCMIVYIQKNVTVIDTCIKVHGPVINV